MDPTISTVNIDNLFDATANNAKAFQDGYTATMNGFQQVAQPQPQTQAWSNEPRRSDGFYQQPVQTQPQYGYAGYGYQQPQYQVPPTYGYGYKEQPYGAYGTPAQNNSNSQTAYYGFWNPAYGK